MPAGSSVLTVEFKVNLLRPARGTAALARAEVLEAGRTPVVVRADVSCVQPGGDEELAATMLATTMCRQGREGVPPG
jgi:acyl-coenzyme A thioesterase PaaI-like protein